MLLAQAAVPDPRLRLDAEQFSNRLSSAVSDGRPLVVAPIRDQMPLLAQFTPNEPRTSIGFRAPSADQIVGSTQNVPVVAQSFPRTQVPRTLRSDSFESGPQSIDSGYRAPGRPQHSNFDDLPPRPPRGRRLAFAAAAILLVLVAAIGGVVWKFGLLSSKHTVPSLVGLTISGASTALTDNGGGFTLKVNYAYSPTTPKTKIVSQAPVAGTTGGSGLAITVVVSKGAQPVAHVIMPTNLLGEDCATATAQLSKLHVVAQCPSSAAITSPTVAAGKIVKVLYHATTDPKSVPRGAAVTLVLSNGPGTTTTVAGTTTTAAGTTTTIAGTTTTSSTTTTTVPNQPLVAVPSVAGLSRTQVFAAMKTAGLYFSTRGPGAGTSKWTTGVSTVPAAGTKVKRLSTVIVNVK
jgi:beta-lactam-binding protein with PASTA domain